MEIFKNYSLKNYNSFGIDVKANYFVNIKTMSDLTKLTQSKLLEGKKYFILGAGSDVLFANDFNGVILNIELKGMHIRDYNDDELILEVYAGEQWHNFVETCVKNGYHGVENLAMIPGKVGAAPVQNIGAYGAEQCDVFWKLKAYNIESNAEIILNKQECKFGYRDSIFKNKLKDKVIITSVEYKLSRKEKFNFSYKELDKIIHRFPWVKPDLQYVFNTICRIRNSKLPNPEILKNAGSFFKNPTVSNYKFQELKKEFPDISGYELKNGNIKLSAAYLIEKAGWKGKRIGDTGVYDKHALILVNYGNASGKDILSLSDKIQDSIQNKFGVKLEKEVIVVE